MTAKVCLLAVLLLVPATSRGGTLHGTFLITQVTDPLNGHPDTDAFNDLVGVPIVFDIHFDGIMSVHNQLGDFQEYPTEFITGPLSVSFGDNASALLRETVAPAIEGGPMDFTILNDAFHHSITLSSLNFGGAADDASFTFELGTTSTSDEVYVPLDEHMYPVLADFSVGSTSILIRRFEAGLGMSDVCFGEASFTFTLGGAVDTQEVSIGTLKSRFR